MMRKYTVIGVLPLIFTLIACNGSSSNEDVSTVPTEEVPPKSISEVAFIDPDFESCVLFDANTNNWTTVDEVISLDCSGASIYNLQGIEAFVELAELNLADNRLSSIDLSLNPKLQTLKISNNPLPAISLSENSALEVLVARNTELVTLDLSNNPALTTVDVDFSKVDVLSAPPSKLFVELLDLDGALENKPLLGNPYLGFEFGITDSEGESTLIPLVSDQPITTSYADFAVELNRLLANSGLEGKVIAELGDSFQVVDPNTGTMLTGTTIVLTNSGAETLSNGGWHVDGLGWWNVHTALYNNRESP